MKKIKKIPKSKVKRGARTGAQLARLAMYAKIRNNTERRVRTIEQQTSIRIGVDYSKLYKNPAKYEKQYAKISIKNMTKEGTMPYKLVEAVQGYQTVGRVIKDPKTGKESYKIVRESITYEGEEARKLLKSAIHNFKIVGVRDIDIPTTYEKYLNRFKNKKEYNKWKRTSRRNAYENIRDTMTRMIEHFDGKDDEKKWAAEAINYYIRIMGVGFVDVLASYGKEGYQVFFGNYNVFDSDQDMAIFEANIYELEGHLETYMPGFKLFKDKYIDKQRDIAASKGKLKQMKYKEIRQLYTDYVKI